MVADAALRAWWLAGDWQQLAPALELVARRAIRSRCDAPDDVDDIAQHTVVRCWESSIVPDAPGKYAFGVARNRWRDVKRSHAVSRRAPVVAAIAIPATDPDPLARAAQRDACQRIVAHLPRKQRDVFLMHYFCGYSYAEISRRLNLPVPALKMRMHRVCASLSPALL